MNEVLEKLIDSLNNGNLLLGVVIIAIAMVFNYKTIIEFFDERKKVRITTLTEALKCDFVTGVTKSHLEEELATEQFKITTGIRLEKQFREAVIKAHQNTKGELGFVHYRRALPHLFYLNESLQVKISTFDNLTYRFNLFFGLILAVAGMLISVLPSQITEITLMQFFAFLGLGIFFMTAGVFMLSQTMPVISARKVDKYLTANVNALTQQTQNVSNT